MTGFPNGTRATGGGVRVNVDPGRAARAAIALTDGSTRIAPDGEEAGVYTVSSFSGSTTYRVTLGSDPCCTCADARFHGSTCKHQLAVALLRGLGELDGER